MSIKYHSIDIFEKIYIDRHEIWDEILNKVKPKVRQEIRQVKRILPLNQVVKNYGYRR